jgi:FAD/FMN-containing dehydrogenase
VLSADGPFEFAGTVALEGSISGEHGIGFAKLPYVGLELSADAMALMRRLKRAFDPEGLLNPGKVLPPEAP